MKCTKTRIYKTPCWKLKVEQHERNKTPIIYKTLHRKFKVEQHEHNKKQLSTKHQAGN
jgi:hypothetical protein